MYLCDIEHQYSSKQKTNNIHRLNVKLKNGLIYREEIWTGERPEDRVLRQLLEQDCEQSEFD